MEDSIDWLMTSGWFVLHVGVIGFGISYLIDMFIFELEGYQWFLAPLGTFTKWGYEAYKHPIMFSERN